MAESAGIFFRIRADSTDARKDIKAVTSEISNLVAIFTGNRLTGATSQITSFGNAISALPGPAGIAVGAIAGIATAAVTATAALLALTKQTSDTGSQIHDLSEQTGLTSETISSLKVASEQAGSSIEGVARGIKTFTVLMGEAAKGNKDAQKTLKDLGVTSTNLDTALAQVIKRIYDLKPGIEQNTAAAEAFGKKIGAELIPVINQFQGDLPGLIEECKKLGLTWSKEDVDAADAFGDEMVLLDKQFQGIKNTIGKELMPVFLDFATQLSGWLSTNRDEVKGWAKDIAAAVTYVANSVELLAKDWEILNTPVFDIQPYTKGIDFTDKMKKLASERDALVQKLADIEAGRYIPGGYNRNAGDEEVQPGGYLTNPIKPTTGGQTITDAEAERKQKEEEDKLYKERLQSLTTYYRSLVEQTKTAYEATVKTQKQAFEDGLISEEQYRKQSEAVRAAAYAKTKQQIEAQASYEKQLAANDIDRKTADVNKEKALTALKIAFKEDELKVSKNISDYNDEVAETEEKLHRLEIAREKEQIAVLNNLLNAWKDYGSTVDDVLNRVNDQLEKWKTLRKEVTDLETANRDEQSRLSDVQGEPERAALVNLVANSYGRVRKQALEQLRVFDLQEAARHNQERQADIEAEKKAALERIKGKENEEEQKLLIEDLYHRKSLISEAEFQAEKQQIEAQFNADSGKGPYGPFQDLMNTWKEFADQVLSQGPKIAETIQSIGGLFVDAFDDMSRALGSVVQQWVLTGQTGPAVMRKILASALATLAAEAAVRAVFELAMGFASLFFNPAEAAAHFTAAALFGSIAVVSGLAGRAIAGDAFKQQSNQATGGAGSSSSRDSANQGKQYSSFGDKAAVDERSRNAPENKEFTVHLKLDSQGVLQVIERDYNNNGRMRVLVQGG